MSPEVKMNLMEALEEMLLLQNELHIDEDELGFCLKGDIYDAYREEMDVEKKGLEEQVNNLKEILKLGL